MVWNFTTALRYSQITYKTNFSLICGRKVKFYVENPKRTDGKTNGPKRTDRKTNGQTYRHHHTIIRPVYSKDGHIEIMYAGSATKSLILWRLTDTRIMSFISFFLRQWLNNLFRFSAISCGWTVHSTIISDRPSNFYTPVKSTYIMLMVLSIQGHPQFSRHFFFLPSL
jgi:hypothetical protein